MASPEESDISSQAALTSSSTSSAPSVSTLKPLANSQSCNLLVTVNSAAPSSKLRISNLNSTYETPIFTLNIPNRLLYGWKENQEKIVQLLNNSIVGGVVQLRESTRLLKRLQSQVRKVVSKPFQGRKLYDFLNKQYTLSVYSGEAESYQDIVH